MKKVVLTLVGGSLIFGIGYCAYLYLGLPDVTVLQTKNPRTTALMLQRYRQAQNEGKGLIIRQQWVSFKRIPKLLKDTIRISEDAGFYHHQGVDISELKAAIKKNWQKGRYARGASTITQQLAKNLYLSTDKTIARKIKELLISMRLENQLDKDRIFHLYLNIIEFGPGLFGVQAASQHFFKKDVGQLNLEEIVRLTAVIPKPLQVNAAGNDRWLKWKAGWILDTLRKYNYIDRMQYRAAIISFQ
ncbi:MAG: monofunctional biosynthetic peptidoglycan transglycosylase [Desulfobacterales bacterium]|nr:MAG: monofunctional biosynthetic peptidoglycan transglycosylase [Desulfobacterales bacterium]